jgi:hypothetical protein
MELDAKFLKVLTKHNKPYQELTNRTPCRGANRWTNKKLSFDSRQRKSVQTGQKHS